MSLKEIQKQVDDWTGQYKLQYWKPHEIITRLMEESGELAREVNHIFGPKKRKATEQEGNLGDEIADVIFTLCCLANSQGIDLDKAFEAVMNKLYTRDSNRFEKK